jgi:hypothetical protein
VNISIDADKGSTVLDPAVKGFAGTGALVTIAADNDSTNVNTSHISHANDSNGDDVHTASAVDNSNTPAYFSNYGPLADCAEPGVNIV